MEKIDISINIRGYNEKRFLPSKLEDLSQRLNKSQGKQ